MYKNIQEIWLTMKRQKNLQVIGIEEQEETQAKTTENVLNKIIEDNFPNLKKEIPINIQEHETDWTRKEIPPHT